VQKSKHPLAAADRSGWRALSPIRDHEMHAETPYFEDLPEEK
jgi:hypothetical protein